MQLAFNVVWVTWSFPPFIPASPLHLRWYYISFAQKMLNWLLYDLGEALETATLKLVIVNVVFDSPTTLSLVLHFKLIMVIGENWAWTSTFLKEKKKHLSLCVMMGSPWGFLVFPETSGIGCYQRWDVGLDEHWIVVGFGFFFPLLEYISNKCST